MENLVNAAPPAGSSVPAPLPDYETLAVLLKAIAYPARLELLDQLRTPKEPREIHLRPWRIREGERADRPAARQTVEKHLAKLEEVELVRLDATRDGSPQYRVNPTKLYALVEELRSVVVRHRSPAADADETMVVSGAPRIRRPHGPRLVLVHGALEGEWYPLIQATMDEAGWVIGRAPELAIRLDYDPFVSHEGARITQDEAGFTITDLGSKNGTRLNWVTLAAGRPQRLASGDVIGVGRSLLLFMAE